MYFYKHFFSIIFLCILHLLYILFVFWSQYVISNYVVDFYEKSYVISKEARQIKERLYQMRVTLPFLLCTPGISKEDVNEVLQIQNKNQDESFAIIAKKSKRKIDEIYYNIKLLRQARYNLLEELGNLSIEHINNYYDTEILPYHRVILEQLNKLCDDAEGDGVAIFQKMELIKKITMLLSLLIGIIIICFLVYTSKKEYAQKKEIFYKDKLFNLIFSRIDDMFFIMYTNGNFEYISDNTKRILGHSAISMLKEKDVFYNFFSEEDYRWLHGILNSCSLTEATERNILFKGDSRQFRLRLYPVLQGDRLERYILALADLTQVYTTQQALSDALETARKASLAKSSFLSHMSHEMRTPMNAIIGMTSIALSRLGDSARVEDCLSKIALSSKFLLQIINDVLDMSKIESGKLIVGHELFSLRKSIQSIVDIVEPQAQSREQHFEVSLVDVDEEQLCGDPLRLHQILLNLLSNALKFTPTGGFIQLKIHQLPIQGNHLTLRFTVRDTGIGMSEEVIRKLYQPFEQATSATSIKYGGTGLGMSITKNLISLLGGTIIVKSEEGNGTEFIVELPFELVGEKHVYDLSRLASLKIMVVDDDRATCEYASLLLNKMGMRTQWVLSGAEAVERVRQAHNQGNDYDICFIDWKMPDMDGEETTRRIRLEVGFDVPLIIMSAYDWSEIETQARSAGVNAFINKPFFASTLYNAIISVTHFHMQEKEMVLERREYDFSGKRILLVEDNELNREVAQELLEMTGAEVETAINGQDAIDKFMKTEAGYYDVILMDVQMPVMNGYTATRAIRSSNHPAARRIPILAMTADAFAEDIAAAKEAGMDGHISKPIDIDVLYRQLETHLKEHVCRSTVEREGS